MYPKVDLEVLAQRKERLRSRIRSRRETCAVEFERVLRPVVWLEDIYAKWKALSPLVKLGAIPLGIFLKKKVFPRSGGVIGGLWRWAPLALDLFRMSRAR